MAKNRVNADQSQISQQNIQDVSSMQVSATQTMDENWRKNVEHAIEKTDIFDLDKTSENFIRFLNDLLSKDISASLKVGMVVDAYPYIRLYRVATSCGIFLCKPLCRGSTHLIGVVDSSTYPVGSIVWFFVIPGTFYGIILGADPQPNTGLFVLNDVICQNSSVGLLNDKSYHLPLLNSLVAADFSARSPVDSLNSGEFCKVSETGSMLFLDSFMLIARINEICGIWMFFLDYLLRIIGHNLQLWTSFSREEYYNHYGIPLYYRGLASSVADNVGTFVPRNVNEFFAKPGSSKYIPWTYGNRHCYKEIFSPLLGGHHRVCEYSDAGVFSENIMLNGSYRVAASSGLHLTKTTRITSPNIAKQPNDSSVQKPDVESVPDFRLNVNVSGGDSSAKQEATSLVEPIIFSDLVNNYLLQGVTYYKGVFTIAGTSSSREASININSDGSITLIDGWGSMIRMTNGKIYLEAPAVIINSFRLVFPIPPVGTWKDSGILLSTRYIPQADLYDHGINAVYGIGGISLDGGNVNVSIRNI